MEKTLEIERERDVRERERGGEEHGFEPRGEEGSKERERDSSGRDRGGIRNTIAQFRAFV